MCPSWYLVASGGTKYSIPWKLHVGGTMRSTVVKRSIVFAGHKTSVSLEDAFWDELKGIAHAQKATLGKLVAEIDETRDHANLSSAIRLYVLEYFRTNGHK
jgi:predicted DNA-binding ribbon-helix-helix protein